jgi:hypothetical protein
MTSLDHTLKYLHSPNANIWNSNKMDFKLFETLPFQTFKKIKSIENRQQFIRDYVNYMDGCLNNIAWFLINEYPTEYFQAFRIYQYFSRIRYDNINIDMAFELLLWQYIIVPKHREYMNLLYYAQEIKDLQSRIILYALQKEI